MEADLEKSNGAIPLSVVKPGEKVRLVAVHAGRGLRARLAAMGLTPGTEVQVVSNHQWGPVIVALKQTRLMLGRGMTQKIHVQSVSASTVT